ncbi:MAG: hypothetical protein H7Y38_19400 [Armatimonadetes bacterium]|nr:hypothetical protein [Armatimonadota bacterium]
MIISPQKAHVMPPTDRESKSRLLFLLGVPMLLFAGFALWGIRERAGQNTSPNWLESPVRVSADRADALAKQREAFAIRKQMATLGKKREWQSAASLVSDDFLRRNDFRNLDFLRAEAWFRAGDERGAIALYRSLQLDNSLPPHEADLLLGKIGEYHAYTTNALRVADAARISTMDANNLAWRTTLMPQLAKSADLEKATTLSEYAVSMARKYRNEDSLANNTNTLGAVYFRAGRGREAVRVLMESEQLRSDPFNAAFLALAYRDLGDSKAATLWRDRLQTYLNNTYATRDGQANRHLLLLFWRETQESASVKGN